MFTPCRPCLKRPPSESTMWQFHQVRLYILYVPISSGQVHTPCVMLYHYHLNHLDHHIYQHHDEQVHRPRRPLHHRHHPLLLPRQHLLGNRHSQTFTNICLKILVFYVVSRHWHSFYPINSISLSRSFPL